MIIFDCFDAIRDLKKTHDFIDTAAVAAVLVAGISVVFIALGKMKPDALVDAALFLLIAWRIYRRSRTWAVIGLLLYIYETIWKLVTRPAWATWSVLAIFVAAWFMSAFIKGVRGTFAYPRLVAVPVDGQQGEAQAQSAGE